MEIAPAITHYKRASEGLTMPKTQLTATFLEKTTDLSAKPPF
jgi:hypothetical protein